MAEPSVLREGLQVGLGAYDWQRAPRRAFDRLKAQFFAVVDKFDRRRREILPRLYARNTTVGVVASSLAYNARLARERDYLADAYTRNLDRLERLRTSADDIQSRIEDALGKLRQIADSLGVRSLGQGPAGLAVLAAAVVAVIGLLVAWHAGLEIVDKRIAADGRLASQVLDSKELTQDQKRDVLRDLAQKKGEFPIFGPLIEHITGLLIGLAILAGVVYLAPGLGRQLQRRRSLASGGA